MSVGQDESLDMHVLLVDLLGRLRVFDDWAHYLDSNTDADDSDKSFTVTADYQWILQSIYIDLTTTSTAGNRQITIEIQDDSANVIAVFKAGATQAASLQRYYTFAPHMPDMTSFRDTSFLQSPLPEMILDEAYVIRVYDSASVDAAADDMDVYIDVKRRPKEA